MVSIVSASGVSAEGVIPRDADRFVGPSSQHSFYINADVIASFRSLAQSCEAIISVSSSCLGTSWIGPNTLRPVWARNWKHVGSIEGLLVHQLVLTQCVETIKLRDDLE